MSPPVDTSSFQLGIAEDEDPEEEGPLLEALAEEVWAFIKSRKGSPPTKEILLTYGVGGILGLFLVRFAQPIAWGELEGETELWTVVGDLPSICFDSEVAPTRALALQLYCAIAQDWAEVVLEGRDLTESYPIPVAPTRQHAEMLRGRIEFIRKADPQRLRF
jgi:hypothetical protein